MKNERKRKRKEKDRKRKKKDRKRKGKGEEQFYKQMRMHPPDSTKNALILAIP